MKTLLRLCLVALALSLTGCAATQVEKLRKRIPAGYAENLNAKITTLGGWGGAISGKNIESDGKGRLSADEYSETVNSPWVTLTIDLTGAGIGKKKLQTKPAKENEVSTEDEK